MNTKFRAMLRYAVAATLFLMAAALLSTLRSKDPVLNELDPLLHLTGRQILVGFGLSSLVISGIVLLARDETFGFVFTGAYATSLLIYRVLLRSRHAVNFSDCLGNFNDWVPVSPRMLNEVWWVALILLIAPSFSAMFLDAVARKTKSPPCVTPEGHGTSQRTQETSPFSRLIFGWCLNGFGIAVAIGVIHLRLAIALPAHFSSKLDEITAIGTFRDLPVGSQTGTKLLYAREFDRGVGFFVKDLNTMNQRRFGAMDDSLSTPDSAFRLIGWSPDERHLALAVDDWNGQTIAVCKGDDQRLERCFTLQDEQKRSAFKLRQEVKRAIWVGNDRMAVIDCFHSIYLADLKNNRIEEVRGCTTVHRNPDDRLGDFSLVATSGHTFAFADGDRIWEYDVNEKSARKLLELPGAGIQWLDYDPAVHRFLFSSMDPNDKNPEKPHYLYRFDTNAGPPVTQISHSNILKGQWILGGRGISYVTGGAVGTLVVDTEDVALRTNLFQGGFVWNYTVSPGRDRIFAQAKLGSEPFSLWEYDIVNRTLRPAVPGLEKALTYAQIAPRVDGYTEKENVPYSVIAPTELDLKKKYAVLIDQPSQSHFTQDAQFLANAGIYYVTVKEDGVDKIMAVYRQIRNIPNIDPSKIYITGSSFRTETLSQAVNDHPELWRGLIFLSPTGFPQIPRNPSRYPGIFISIGTKDEEVGLLPTERFTSDACANLVRTKVVYHEGAAHIFNSTTLAKERFSAIIEFILAGS